MAESCEHGDGTSDSIKCVEIFDWQGRYNILDQTGFCSVELVDVICVYDKTKACIVGR